MRREAKLRVGHVLGVGFGHWIRRFVPIHAVAALCLAPIAIVPGKRDPVEDGTIPGLYGLYSSAWLVSMDLLFEPETGLLGNVAVGYMAQFAVTVLVARDAHRRLARRGLHRNPASILGLAVYAIASLAAFSLLDLAASGWLRNARSPVAIYVAFIALNAAQAALAGMFWLALPAAAVDGHALFASLGRSVRLGRGSRLRIAVPVVMLVTLQMGLAVAFGFLFMDREPWIYAVPGVLLLTLKASVLAAAYREICLLKEGPRPEEIGAIFA